VVPAPEPITPPPPPDAELEIEVDVPVSVVHALRPDAAPDPAPIPETRVKPKAKVEPQSIALAQASTKVSAPGTEAFKVTAEETPSTQPTEAANEAPTPIAAAFKPTPREASPKETPGAPDAVRPHKKHQAPSRPRMLTLTLLDGTQVKLPAPTPQTEETSAEHHLTSRDLIQALLLHAEGKDVSAVLRDPHWETLFAALLSLLLKKGLVADWEFVEAWTKMRRQKGT
jgi:type IV pilus assembly protein PilB